MGKIFYLMGKSASGKDTMYKKILELCPDLKTYVMYTTRPIRDGEKDGVEYFFVTDARLKELESLGKVIEKRVYHTVHGPWSYFTVDDGQIDFAKENYLTIGTLESYEAIRNYYGENNMVPLYLEVSDETRLLRSIDRERQQAVPKFKEICRRFLADEEDFKEENLLRLNIIHPYNNEDSEQCKLKIVRKIQEESNC